MERVTLNEQATKMSYDYEITRAEATKLVELYMKCTNDPLSQKGRKCKYTVPMATFRNMTKLEHMGAVLVGKYPSQTHTENSDIFFNSIKELVECIGKEENHITRQRIIATTMRKYCNLSCGEDEHCKFIICPVERVVRHLQSAINNYLQQNHEYITEKLCDNTYEYNVCYVCQLSYTDYFYYSTIYGLNVPVCSVCVEAKEKEDFENEAQAFKCDELKLRHTDVGDADQEEEEIDEYTGYVFVYKEDENEENTCYVCNYVGIGSFYYSSDKMNEPVCDTCEMNYRNTADCEKRIYFDEQRNRINYQEEDYADETYSQENQDDEDDDDDREKFFGCEGCQYEWRDGWKKGWKAAMKKINKFTKQQKRPENIHIPECAYCGASHNLKKCAGTCEGVVRYCSTVCQKKDWKEGHKHECSRQ